MASTSKSMFDDSSDEDCNEDHGETSAKGNFEGDKEKEDGGSLKELLPNKKQKTEHCPKVGSSTSEVPIEPEIVLTPAMRARMEHNRQKALMIRQEKRNKKMTMEKKKDCNDQGKKIVRINDVKMVDSGGGFFMEEMEEKTEKQNKEELLKMLEKNREPAPLLKDDQSVCSECGNRFDDSYLLKHFDHSTCDDCRDNDTKHSLVTKTDARNDYLLQDVDLEKRPPPLRYILRKNPHNERWGDMKLYLKLQVEKRCLEVWGSEEALEEAIIKKDQQREIAKQKKFKKKMQELRMNVRSSIYTRATKSHVHEYGEEEYLQEEDEYRKTCTTCGHSYNYDKL